LEDTNIKGNILLLLKHDWLPDDEGGWIDPTSGHSYNYIDAVSILHIRLHSQAETQDIPPDTPKTTPEDKPQKTHQTTTQAKLQTSQKAPQKEVQGNPLVMSRCQRCDLELLDCECIEGFFDFSAEDYLH